MTFTDTDIDAMLAGIGQTATIDDGSVKGLDIYCKFVDPENIVTEFGQSIEATDPAVKVRRTAVEGFLDRGLRLTTGGKDYTVKKYFHRTSGFSFLALEDV